MTARRVEFVGTRQWITMSVRHDPAQSLVLAGASLGLAGLTLSLFGRRRRVWFRVAPAAGPSAARCLVEAGGLPRTEQPDFADEFARLVEAVNGTEVPPSDGEAVVHPDAGRSA